MKRTLIAVTVGAAAAVAASQLARATPSAGVLSAPMLARASLAGEIALQSGPVEATGLTWSGRTWRPRQLPEFLAMLRDKAKVSDLGAWLASHPAAARRLGLPVARRIASPDVAVQQVTIAAGGHTGWHTHPGPAIVLVKSGTLTLYDGDEAGCRGTTYTAGQTFVDRGFGHVHIARNEGSTPVEFYVIYIAPQPSGQPLRVDAAKPARSGCAF